MMSLAAMVFPFIVMCNGAEVTLNEIIHEHGTTVRVEYTAFRGDLQVNAMTLRPMTDDEWAENKEKTRIYVVERYKQVACLGSEA